MPFGAVSLHWTVHIGLHEYTSLPHIRALFSHITLPTFRHSNCCTGVFVVWNIIFLDTYICLYTAISFFFFHSEKNVHIMEVGPLHISQTKGYTAWKAISSGRITAKIVISISLSIEGLSPFFFLSPSYFKKFWYFIFTRRRVIVSNISPWCR